MTQARMIDVSSNNHPNDKPIDWQAVAGAGYGHVMIKCSEGVGYVNPWLKRDADGAHGAGLKVGYYHFALPTAASGPEQASFALAAIAGLPRDLGLALDLEVSEGLDWAVLALFGKGFHGQARKTVEHSPLYVNAYYLANLPGAPFGERLWLAQTDRPRREVWAWQETAPATVPGIEGLVDVGWLRPDV